MGELVAHKTETAIAEFARPGVPARRRPKRRILEEESFVAAIEKIVERDFFPDLPKLRAQAEYIKAYDDNDFDRLREIKIRFQTPLVHGPGETPAAFETPSVRGTPAVGGAAHRVSSGFDTPSVVGTPAHGDIGAAAIRGGGGGGGAAAAAGVGAFPPQLEGDDVFRGDVDTSVSLDEFLTKYTCEDNDSFEDLLEKTQARIRAKFESIYGKPVTESALQQTLALPGPPRDAVQLALTDGRPGAPGTWKFTPKNALMYVPDGVAPSVKEAAEAALKRVEVHHANTRFEVAPFPATLATPSTRATASSVPGLPNAPAGAYRAAEAPAGDGSDSPKVNGYGFVVTPSPAPAASMDPTAAWGMMHGVPFRLDAGDVAVPMQNPAFAIPEATPREQLGLRMEEQVRAKRRGADTPRAATPRSRDPGTPASKRLAMMSPAAQRLGRGLLGGMGQDVLRGSYTPGRSDGGSVARATPTRATPGSSRVQTPSQAWETRGETGKRRVVGSGARRESEAGGMAASITDDLLM